MRSQLLSLLVTVVLNDDSSISILSPAGEGLSHREIAAAVLGIGAGTSANVVGKLLVDHNHTAREAQVEEAKQKATEVLGKPVYPDQGTGIFFVETFSQGVPARVGFDGFLAGCSCLLGDDARCHPDDVIFIRNLNLARFGCVGTSKDDVVCVGDGPGTMMPRLTCG
ncbi:MAG: hypothetical protein ACYC48_03030 [Minisyncoccota bacterium]